MESTILLLQTERIILQHLKNSISETVQAMRGRLSYEAVEKLNRSILVLEKEIITLEIKMESLKQL